MLCLAALLSVWAEAGELVSNPNSPDAWRIEALPGNGTLRGEQGALRIDVSAPSPEPWKIQIYQDGKNLTKGKTYILRFTAKASVSRTINITGQLQEEPWTGFWYEGDVRLTTSYKPYEFTFTPDHDTGGRGRMPEFAVGGTAGTVWIKDVSVRDVDDKPAAAASAGPVVIIPAAEVVADDKFELQTNSGARASMQGDAGADRIDIQQMAQQSSAVQIFKKRPELAAGRYVLTFSAKADRPRKIDILPVQEQAEPYRQLTGVGSVDVTTDWQKCAVRFQILEAGKGVRTPVFRLGGSLGTVWIKDCTVEAAPR